MAGHPISEERIALLKDTKTKLDDLSGTISDILEGRLSQAEAARRLGITPQRMNDDIGNQFLSRLHKCQALGTKQIKAILKDVRTPYEKLVYDIFGIDLERDGIFLMDDSGEEHLDHAISAYLNEKEALVVRLRYGIPDKTKMTLDEVANTMDLSSNYVRQIQAQAIRKLRKPSVWNPLLDDYGIVTKAEKEIELLRQRNETMSKRYDALVREYRKLQKENHVLEKEDPTPDEVNEIITNHKYEMLSLPMQSLPISARLRNALKRNGCYTMEDVVNHTEKEIKAFRNIGRNSFDELVKLLESMDLAFKTE